MVLPGGTFSVANHVVWCLKNSNEYIQYVIQGQKVFSNVLMVFHLGAATIKRKKA